MPATGASGLLVVHLRLLPRLVVQQLPFGRVWAAKPCCCCNVANPFVQLATAVLLRKTKALIKI